MSERDPVNAAMEHAASTLLLGIAFAGMSHEEYLNWCGHARMVVDELRGLGVEIHEGDEIAAREYPKQQSKSGTNSALDEEMIDAAREALSALGKVVHGAIDPRASHHAYVRLDAALGGMYPTEARKPGRGSVACWLCGIVHAGPTCPPPSERTEP